MVRDLATPCFGHEPKARVVIVYIKFTIFFIVVLIMAKVAKGFKGPFLLVLRAFYKHKVLLTL